MVDYTSIPSLGVGPARRIVPITPANTDFANGVCRALLVGTAGNADLVEFDGTTRTSVPLQAGYNPLSVLQVKTGATAANIWALY